MLFFMYDIITIDLSENHRFLPLIRSFPERLKKIFAVKALIFSTILFAFLVASFVFWNLAFPFEMHDRLFLFTAIVLVSLMFPFFELTMAFGAITWITAGKFNKESGFLPSNVSFLLLAVIIPFMISLIFLVKIRMYELAVIIFCSWTLIPILFFTRAVESAEQWEIN